MALLERALRISTSRVSRVLPASSIWTSPTAAAGSPEICAGLALLDPDLRGPVGSACADYPRNPEYAHDVRIAKGFPMLRGCEVPGIDFPLSRSSSDSTSRDIDKLPEPISICAKPSLQETMMMQVNTSMVKKAPAAARWIRLPGSCLQRQLGMRISPSSDVMNTGCGVFSSGSMSSSHLKNMRRPFSSVPEDGTTHLSHAIGSSLLEKEVLLPHSPSIILPGKEVLLPRSPSIILPGQVPPINQLDCMSSLKSKTSRCHFSSKAGTFISGEEEEGKGGMEEEEEESPPWSCILASPLLPPAPQLNFFTPQDVLREEWVDPVEHLFKNPAIDLVPDLGLMLSERGRIWARSLVKLVAFNRKRGYDIAKCLRIDNLLISKTYGTFAIKKFFDYEYTSETFPFMGYKAAKRVLEDLLETAYWQGVIGDLTEDVEYFFCALGQDEPDERKILYNVALLSRAGRVGFSVRLDYILRLQRPRIRDWDKLVTSFFMNLPYTTVEANLYPTDYYHRDFLRWRLHSANLRDTMSESPSASVAKGSASKRETGRWLVIMNRHGVLHPKGLQSAAVDLLHYRLPGYFPKAQDEVIHAGFWGRLRMRDFFPEDNIIGFAVLHDDFGLGVPSTPN